VVDNHEQVRDSILKLITYVADLDHFSGKMEVVNALYNVEWSLRFAKDKR